MRVVPYCPTFLRYFLILSGAGLVAPAHIVETRSSSEGFTAGLTLPAAGIRAGQSLELFLRILEPLGPAATAETGVPCKSVAPRIDMPGMAGMPEIVPAARTLGYPGSYALKMAFPHGGIYRLRIGFVPATRAAAVDVTFLLDVADEDTDPLAWRPFELRVLSFPGRVSAGHQVRLSLSVRLRDGGDSVRAFDVVHERLIHLIIVRDDLGAFFHEHPVQEADGSFSLRFAFPSAGTWRLFADMAPAGAGSQVASATLIVAGRAQPRQSLVVASPTIARSGDSLVSLLPSEIVSGKTSVLAVSLSNLRGSPLTDLEPWLGARAHLILISQDARSFVHAHVEDSDAALPNAPLLFQTRFPKPGLYRAWIQFQRNGRITTITFVLRCA